MAWCRIDDSKLVAIANAIRTKLNSAVKMTPDEMPSMIGQIEGGASEVVVPAYWTTYLNTKANEINSALNAAGDNRSAFLWYTDAHWAINHGQSPLLLKYLSKNTGMSKTFYGGDITNSDSGEIASIAAWQEQVRDIPNHHSVIGNHDNQVSELSTAKERADFFFNPERTGDVVFGTDATNGKNYYYIDNHAENTRYICLSTGRMYTWSDEVEWCINVLNSTPQGWHIVAISHLWLNSSGGNIVTTPEDYTQVYLDLFDAYNDRESGTTSLNNKTYDFSNAQARVEFIVGGHVHTDYDFTTTKGIPVILTECDCWEERDSASVATQGTITENCVYAIVSDYDAKTIKVINIGRGHTRDIALSDAVKYTNWLTKIANTDGTISDGKNYKENTRLNSSGGETSESGWFATGLIPAKPGDVIRLKNCYFPTTYSGGTNRSSVHPYDTSGTFKGNYASASGLPDIVNAYDTDGVNIIQITIPNWFASTYIRLTVRTLSNDSVITVNEEIP